MWRRCVIGDANQVGVALGAGARRGVRPVGVAMFGDVWRSLAMSGDVWRCLAMFGDVWRCLAMSGGLGR